jgi:hypothetical protein
LIIVRVFVIAVDLVVLAQDNEAKLSLSSYFAFAFAFAFAFCLFCAIRC